MGRVQSFNVLQQRLNRKTATSSCPNFPRICAYDLLVDGEEDLRDSPSRNDAWLERSVARLNERRVDLSPLVAFASWEELAAARANPGIAGAGADVEAVEGIMLKRRDAPYLPGRTRGPWWEMEARPAHHRRGADVRAAR